MPSIEYEIAELVGMLPQLMGVISRGCEITVPINLSLSERRTLMNVRAYPNESMCFYSRKAGLSRASMTSVADRLEQKGLIRRQPTEADRRVFSLNLTKSGRDVAQAVHEQFIAFIANKVSAISYEDKAEFRTALHTLITMMEKFN